MTRWRDLFTARQKLAFLTIIEQTSRELAAPEAEATQRLFGLVVSKLTNLLNAGAPWKIDRECPVSLIAGQRIPPVWDWCEAVPLSDSSGSLASSVDRVADAVTRSCVSAQGITRLADAVATGLPHTSAAVYFTDPPYYNAVPYADLSDFYFVWLKRLLTGHGLAQDPFDATNALTPKRLEAVQDESKLIDGKPKDRAYFESKMAMAFTEGRRVLDTNGLGCVVFAHKTTEGWEALLTGLVGAGWVITASWPIATEMRSRLRARASAALATSVHLVCRPRSEDAPVGDWAEVLRELPLRVGEWMERLQKEGIRGADLVFACVGPALEIFSRYSKVVDAEEREIPLGGDPEASEPHKRGFLAYVWEVVGRTAREQVLGTAEARARNSAAGALEEDARLTALFLWTLQSTNGEANHRGDAEYAEEEADEDEENSAPSAPQRFKGFSLVFDVVRRFAQPLGIHLPEWEGRIIETKKGVVRLLPVEERAKQLFGKEGASAVADQIERTPTGQVQLRLFGDSGAEPEIKGRGRGRKKAAANVGDEALRTHREATTLDRVHAAMLLQAGGRTNALRALLEAEQQRGPDFLRLANALSALYPRDSEEKRLLDAMLLAVPR